MKTALVTGSAKRIGAAIVKDLAANGFNVAVHSVSSHDAAEGLCEIALKQGVKACSVSGDLTDAKSTRQVFANAANALGPIDLLVNNASIFEDDTAHEFDGQTWDNHFAIHLKAPAILAAEMMKQSINNGLIVNMIDQRVKRLNPNFFSYTLSKSALWTATQTMAQSFAPQVRVNALAVQSDTYTTHQVSPANCLRWMAVNIWHGKHLMWQGLRNKYKSIILGFSSEFLIIFNL